MRETRGMRGNGESTSLLPSSFSHYLCTLCTLLYVLMRGFGGSLLYISPCRSRGRRANSDHVRARLHKQGLTIDYLRLVLTRNSIRSDTYLPRFYRTAVQTLLFCLFSGSRLAVDVLSFVRDCCNPGGTLKLFLSGDRGRRGSRSPACSKGESRRLPLSLSAAPPG